MITQASDLVFEHGPSERKVAVIVPLHNYQHYIEETLDSVVAQSFRDILLVVVDDCSSDRSADVVDAWMKRRSTSDISLRLLKNRANARLAITRNTGIGHAANAQYCFFLDADNILYPRCIEKHAQALDCRTGAPAAYAIIEKFGDECGLIGVAAHGADRLRNGNYIDAMAMFRRDYLTRNGGYRNIPHGWEDYDLWLRLCEEGEAVIHLPEILSRYRVHKSSMLRTQTNADTNIRELHKIISLLHPWIALR